METFWTKYNQFHPVDLPFTGPWAIQVVEAPDNSLGQDPRLLLWVQQKLSNKIFLTLEHVKHFITFARAYESCQGDASRIHSENGSFQLFCFVCKKGKWVHDKLDGYCSCILFHTSSMYDELTEDISVNIIDYTITDTWADFPVLAKLLPLYNYKKEQDVIIQSLYDMGSIPMDVTSIIWSYVYEMVGSYTLKQTPSGFP